MTEAEKFRDMVLRDLEHDPNSDEGINNAYVYAHDTVRAESFMLAGNGPSAWAWFVFDTEGDLDHAYIEFSDTGGSQLAFVPPYKQEPLLAALRASVANGIERKR